MYSETRRRLIAHEIARAGGNIAEALRRLREGYEDFREIGETTLRRLMKSDGFAELVAERAKTIGEIHESEIRSAEAKRIRAELEGSLVGELRADEVLLIEARKKFEEALNDTEITIDQKLRAFQTLANIVEKRRAQTLPAVANTREASLLVLIFAEEAQAMFGPERAKKWRDRVRERYLKEVAALPSIEATATAAS